MLGLHTMGKKYKDIPKTVLAQNEDILFNHDNGSVLPPRKLELEMRVRVLNKDYICVVINPNKFLKSRAIAHGSASIKDIEEGTRWPQWDYPLSFWQRWQKVTYHYWPQMIKSLREPGHWLVNAIAPTVYGMLQCKVDNLAYAPINDAEYAAQYGTRHTTLGMYEPNWGDSTYMTVDNSQEYGIYCYIKMPSTMTDGTTYDVLDVWGNHAAFTYTDVGSHSWAVKVNQLGYINAANKYGYLGMWMGPDLGGLDFSGYSGNTFHLRRVSDDVSVYSSTIAYYMDDPQRLMSWDECDGPTPPAIQYLTGEHKQYELDFSAYTTTGEYYLQVDGIGKSWPFKIGTAGSVYGPLFYHTSRSLYHQRGHSDFTSSTSNFPHSTKYLSYKVGGLTPVRAAEPDEITMHYVAGMPDGESEFLCGLKGYGDAAHTWGFYDVTKDEWCGEWGADWSIGGDLTGMPLRNYYVADWDTVTEWDSSVQGGFHDAADIDRRPMHLNCAIYLCIAYLMNPTRFTDNQLDLPESGDGLPDILSNAEWGIEWIKTMQGLIGTGGAPITAEGEHHNASKYVTGEPTRICTYYYAYAAALFGKACLVAGATTLGNTYIASAESAWDWASTVDQQTFSNSGGTKSGSTIKYTEPPTTHEFYIRARMYAAVGLRIATEEAEYLTALSSIGIDYLDDYIISDPASNWDNHNITTAGRYGHSSTTILTTPIAMYSSLMPTNWGANVETGIDFIANFWLANYLPYNPYREVWQSLENYWTGSAWAARANWPTAATWGVRGTANTAVMFIAYELTGTQVYLDAALNGMDYYLGCNAHGRTEFSGIGSSSIYRWLYLAGNNQMHGEWTRGFELFNTTFAIDSAMYSADGDHSTGPFRCSNSTARSDWDDGKFTNNVMVLPKPYENLTRYGDESAIDTYFPYMETYHSEWGYYSKTKRLFGHIFPWYRRRSHTYGHSVDQNEYTVYQNQAPSILAAALAMGTGWSPGSTTETNWAARTEDEMFDSKYFQP